MKINFSSIGSSVASFLLWWRNDVKRKSTKQAIRSIVGSVVVFIVLIPLIFVCMQKLQKWNTIPIYECDVVAYNAMVANDSSSYVHYKMGIFSGSVLKDSTLRTYSEYAADTLSFNPSRFEVSVNKKPLNVYLGDSLYWEDSIGTEAPIYINDSVRMLYYIGSRRSLSINLNRETSIITIRSDTFEINSFYGFITAINHEPFAQTPIAQKYFQREIQRHTVSRDFVLWSAYPILFNLNKPVTLVCSSDNSHENRWHEVFASKDISQAYIKIRTASNIIDFDFEICFTGAAECSQIYPQPDYMDCRTIRFDNITEKNYPENGITIHAKFPEQENVQSIRSFMLTMIITIFVTVILRYLYTFASSICCIVIKRKKSTKNQ